MQSQGPPTPTTLSFAPPIESTDIFETCPEEASPRPAGVKRWLSTLRRRKHQAQLNRSPGQQPWTVANFGSRSTSPAKDKSLHHKNTDSQGSSMAFVSAVKSATATIASASIATVSRRNARWRRGHQRSSMLSGSDPRPSMDSHRSIMDEAAKQRSKRRREKIEELIRTEENYVADIKALSNAYCTIIGHQPSPTSFARICAQKNISAMLQLHDDLLGQLHRIVPFAECDQRMARMPPGLPSSHSHTRWHSVDVVPSQPTPTRSKLASIRQARRSLNINRSVEDDHPMLRCSPFVVSVMAKAFREHMNRFALYEEYGANYEVVLSDIDDVQRATSMWSDFDRAIEALSVHVNPVKSREANRKKAMTVKDLLIKPIQRLPRYELLFGDLCKLTPVCDDPEANAAIQDLLHDISAACRRMNEAKDDPVKSRMLEATWLLGDRLTFSNQVPRSVFLQLLGQVHLCGCLHIAYRSKDRIKGLYAICILFDSTLLVAIANEDPSRYATLAGIPLANAAVVESDNGKGLQCYTAPHSWKLVFEYSARMFEIIFTACSATEADVWRQHIGDSITSQSQAVAEGQSNVFELHSPLIAEMRSVGKAFGKPGSFVRRMSVHRTATVGPTTDLNQVIIKNTQAAKEALETSSTTSLQIPRSQSMATPSHVQTLAPGRADRVRLESILCDVWTKDLLPYPGMQPRRSDPIRASANHVIRKFSMASITSNFSSSKRSASYTSISTNHKEDMPPPKLQKSMRGRANTNKPTARPPLVDFHNAPEAFLPEDFELQVDRGSKRKKSALRTLTMTMERPFSPLLGHDQKASVLRRAQSVKEVGGAKSSVPMATSGDDSVGDDKSYPPAYSVGRERTKTLRSSDETIIAGHGNGSAKTPKKSKSSKILRLFKG
ncbi:hypothetical protein BDY17DRAFT_250617 [Neohortaea acidophila]|uniref:DH domain-containing protein n=1 Tax=Neohortaea acidophila TaxID=245834 RepID=A0A6A6PU63_9PEZI|nr:uncharacterized protein BDY17DRAFT_250617 [Neohortaea acidophila]KAF2483224.1 hypothetical protein BDY17DRAFT_250617 [Neohortaea acidophila]